MQYTLVKQVSEQSCRLFHLALVTIPVHCRLWNVERGRMSFYIRFVKVLPRNMGRTHLKLPGIENAPRKKIIEAAGLHVCFQGRASALVKV